MMIYCGIVDSSIYGIPSVVENLILEYQNVCYCMFRVSLHSSAGIETVLQIIPFLAQQVATDSFHPSELNK